MSHSSCYSEGFTEHSVYYHTGHGVRVQGLNKVDSFFWETESVEGLYKKIVHDFVVSFFLV